MKLFNQSRIKLERCNITGNSIGEVKRRSTGYQIYNTEIKISYWVIFKRWRKKIFAVLLRDQTPCSHPYKGTRLLLSLYI